MNAAERASKLTRAEQANEIMSERCELTNKWLRLTNLQRGMRQPSCTVLHASIPFIRQCATSSPEEYGTMNMSSSGEKSILSASQGVLTMFFLFLDSTSINSSNIHPIVSPWNSFTYMSITLFIFEYFKGIPTHGVHQKIRGTCG